MQEFIGEIFQIMLTIIAILVTILLAILVPFWGYMWWRNRKLETFYKVMWKKSSKLKPQDLLDHRAKKKYGFHDYYYFRQEDKLIEKKLTDNEHTLVIGNPLAGKTRAIYEVLSRSKRKYDISIPHLVDISNPVDIHIPMRFTFWRKRVIVVDDIHKYADKQGFFYFLKRLSDDGIIILTTCRSESEYDYFCEKLKQEQLSFSNPIEISPISKNTAEFVAGKVGLSLPDQFKGNIGTIFVRLDVMKETLKASSDIEELTLSSLRRLHAAGVYRGKEVFSIQRVKRVCEKREGIKREDSEWQVLIDTLENNGFVEKVGDHELRVEETYLEQVIEDDFSPLDNLREMLAIFSNDPDALYDIGYQALTIGFVDLQKVAFMKVAVEACDKTLEVWTYDNNPEKYAMTQNNLGISYGNLAELEETAENCRAAIAAFQEALIVRTLDHFPIQYANTQMSIGNVYALLPEARDKVANCRLAINAYREALKVYSLDHFPFNYAMTQNNLGATYQNLAELEEVENKVANCKLAISAIQKALKVYNFGDFPKEYAMTQNNFGNTYQTLADAEKEAEKKATNYKLAIEAYHKTLKVYSLDYSPIDYAGTENNLGKAYRKLAELEEKPKNCRLAIAAFQEALKVSTFDQFPIPYAKTQIGLGTAYGTLAEVEGRAENCKKAKTAFEEALRVCTEETLPQDYVVVTHNLEILHGFCEDVF